MLYCTVLYGTVLYLPGISIFVQGSWVGAKATVLRAAGLCEHHLGDAHDLHDHDATDLANHEASEQLPEAEAATRCPTGGG